MTKFFDFRNKCIGCATPWVKDFIDRGVIGSKSVDWCGEPPCIGAMSCNVTCENVGDRVHRICCPSRTDACPVPLDGRPSLCPTSGGCQDAVLTSALDICPSAFVTNSSQLGLYADCGGDVDELVAVMGDCSAAHQVVVQSVLAGECSKSSCTATCQVRSVRGAPCLNVQF